MAIDWISFVDSLKDDAGILAKDELKEFINNARNDSQKFLRRQGQKLEIYMKQLAAGQISKRQFEGYVLDIRDLTELKALKMRVRTKARAQRLIRGITDLIIDKFLSLL